MAPSRAQIEQDAASSPEPSEVEQVRRVGVREFRATFKKIYQSQEPVIVTRGPTVIAVLCPVYLAYWDVHSALTAAQKKLKRDAARAAQFLTRW